MLAAAVKASQSEMLAALGRVGCSTQQVADLMGLDRTTVSRRVSGKVDNLTLRSLVEFALAVGAELRVEFHFASAPKYTPKISAINTAAAKPAAATKAGS